MGALCSSSSENANSNSNYEFDFLVIGGGSGGIAAAREAAVFGKKVCLCDFVKPSPVGTRWGVGGTCVNVGCIPKKLMHQAGLLKSAISDSVSYGWKTNASVEHDWVVLRDNVEFYIRSLNFGLRLNIIKDKITYENAFAEFVDKHTVRVIDKKNLQKKITANHILIAVGGRPKYLDIPGGRKEDALCISSDDLFYLPTHPGKVLCIGASYIAVECTGFLAELGVNTTMMVRSKILREFDSECAEKVQNILIDHGVKVLLGWVPESIEKVEGSNPTELKVSAKNNATGETDVQTYNTVLLAIGRESCTPVMKLEKAGIKVHEQSKKIIVDASERSSVKNIFALGDCAEDRPELTPPAIQAGVMLARRLYGKSSMVVDYNKIASVVFSPLEYGFVGMSEEKAIEKYGKSKIEAYVTIMQPLEFTLPDRDTNTVFYKIITTKGGKETVLGLHYIGPNAGEVIQGFSTALRLNVTKQDLDMTIGIHPTTAEIFTKVDVTKSSGKKVEKTAC